ncbi:hypothetical protein [Streptomyces sp. NPDC052721]|uniref:hypothetical protein n=1 Tax=Streptomyces sp. NPDC052721 TaxID=3154955 RepID=UPI0034458CE4
MEVGLTQDTAAWTRRTSASTRDTAAQSRACGLDPKDVGPYLGHPTAHSQNTATAPTGRA